MTLRMICFSYCHGPTYRHTDRPTARPCECGAFFFQNFKKLLKIYFNGCRELEKTRPVWLNSRISKNEISIRANLPPSSPQHAPRFHITHPPQPTYTGQPTGQPALHLCLPDTLAAERREVRDARAWCLFGPCCVGRVVCACTKRERLLGVLCVSRCWVLSGMPHGRVPRSCFSAHAAERM